MKKGLLIIALLCFSLGFSQSSANKKAATDFQTAYNASNYEAIFNMFDTEMKAKMPLERTVAFYTRIKASRGDIKTMEYYNVKDQAAVYKTTFAKDVMDIRVSVNNTNGKVSGLYIVAQQKK